MDAVIWSSGPFFHDESKTAMRYLGPYKIAHSVRSHGYTAQVIDHIVWMSEQRLYDVTKKFIDADTAVLAISCTFLCQRNYDWPDGTKNRVPWNVRSAVLRIKQEFPKIKIILGGYLSESVGRAIPADAAISQYGEDIFLEIVEHLKSKKPEPLFDLRSPAFRSDIRRKVYTQARNKRHDIETDDHLFTDQDCIVPGETLPLEISRGCIFSCKFCNHLLLGRGKLDYLRNFDLVKREIIHNYERWGVTNYQIICDTFNDTTIKMNAWSDMVQSLPFKIRFVAYLRADLLHRFPEVPVLLKESGLTAAYHGIESLGEEASRIIGKGWSGKQARDWIPKLYHDIWNKEVYQHTSFIVGLPGDTRESLLDTARWYIDNDLYSTVFQTLSLNRLASRHSSEFERNHEKYGYSFMGDSPTEWRLPYWNIHDADQFRQQVLNPMLAPHRASYWCWDILSMMTYGFKAEDFWDKKKSRGYAPRVEKGFDDYLRTYNQLLDDL